MIQVSVQKLTKLFGQNNGFLLDLPNIVKEKPGNQLGLFFVKKNIRGMSYKTFTARNCRIIFKRRKSSILQNKFYYLKNENKSILMTTDAWLNNRIMDTTQKLICKALGKIGSFQSVLNLQRRWNYPFWAVNNEHIQLLHDGNNHWLLSFCSVFAVPVDVSRYAIGWKTTLVGLYWGV